MFLSAIIIHINCNLQFVSTDDEPKNIKDIALHNSLCAALNVI